MRLVKGGITAPIGFLASGVKSGVKKSKRLDLALLFSEVPAVCAGTFTINKIKSGSVLLSEKHIKKGRAQAVVVNSGNANACVGKKEIEDAEKIIDSVSSGLELDRKSVLIASTGIIGRPLEIKKIKGKIPHLIEDLKRTGGTRFSKAIMTTDTVHKEIAVRINIGHKPITIAGAAKGSGMICPSMATMLAFFTTDALIKNSALKAAFKESVSSSFNRITVDGDMSTNDTAIIFANGLAGNRLIKEGTSPDYLRFLTALKFISRELAKRIVLDGEGATKFVEIVVKGARSPKSADAIARHVADSNLIKTMITGGDPNWGRVASSVGSSGVNFKRNRLDIRFGKYLVMKNSRAARLSKKALMEYFRKKEIHITIDLKSGRHSAKMWTCDLTKDYVEINSKYTT